MEFLSPLTPAQLARRVDLLARTGIAAGEQIRLSATARWEVAGDRFAFVAAPYSAQRRAQLAVRGMFSPDQNGCLVQVRIRPPGVHFAVYFGLAATAGGLATWGLWPISPWAGPILAVSASALLAAGFGLDFFLSRRELVGVLERALTAPAAADVREEPR